MAREELSNFLLAAEHSLSLRRKLKICSNNQAILDLATSYGFSLTINDLQEDPEAERIISWFENSKIAPIKKNIHT